MNEGNQTLMQESSKVDNDESAVKSQKKKRIKVSIYLTEEAEEAFRELYIHHLRKDRRADKSMIACEAILALYQKECV